MAFATLSSPLRIGASARPLSVWCTCRYTASGNVSVITRLHAERAMLSTDWVPEVPRPLGSAGGVGVVWLQRDALRLRDNAVLYAACADVAVVAPLFIIHKALDATTSCALFALRNALRSRGGELYVQKAVIGASDADIVAWFAERTRARVVHAAHAKNEHEHALTCRAEKALQGCGVRLVRHWEGFVRNPDTLPFDLHRAPRTADEFAHRVADVPVPKLLSAPDQLRSPGSLVEPGAIREEPCRSERPDLWGEAGAWQRLNGYIKGRSLASVECVKKRKVNTSYGSLAEDIQMGCISARSIYVEVRRRLPKLSLKYHCAELELLLRDFHMIRAMVSQYKKSGLPNNDLLVQSAVAN